MGSSLQTSSAQLLPATPVFPFFPWSVGPPTGAALWAWPSCLSELLVPHSEEGQHGHSLRREQEASSLPQDSLGAGTEPLTSSPTW